MITQIRLEHDVNIQFPDKDDGNQVRKTTRVDTPLTHSGDLCPDLGTVARQTWARWVVERAGFSEASRVRVWLRLWAPSWPVPTG